MYAPCWVVGGIAGWEDGGRKVGRKGTHQEGLYKCGLGPDGCAMAILAAAESFSQPLGLGAQHECRPTRDARATHGVTEYLALLVFIMWGMNSRLF